MPNCDSNPSTVRAWGTAMIPALATSTSSRSWSACTPSVKARIDANDARSTSRSSTFAPVAVAAARTGVAAASPFCRLRTAMITLAPWAATALAVSWPMPEDAPVTSTHWPVRSTPARTSSVVEVASKVMAA